MLPTRHVGSAGLEYSLEYKHGCLACHLLEVQVMRVQAYEDHSV